MQTTYDRIQYYKVARKQKNSIIAVLKRLLAANEQVKLAWLFGSLIRRESIRDVDVAIQTEPELAFREFLELNAQMELKLGIPVDLVEIAKVPESLRTTIIANGIKLKETN